MVVPSRHDADHYSGIVHAEGPAYGPHSELDAELRADLLDVLDDVTQWRLASQRWQQVYDLLGAITDALASGDIDALRVATGELELAGPVRITRIGATPADPPPDDVQERVNHLKHSLRSLDRPADQTSDKLDRSGQ
jgi:hypothetical protein